MCIQGSEKEKEDLLVCYNAAKGDWNKMWETHMCYHGVEDEPRLMEIIKKLVEEGRAEAYDAFFKEPKAKRDRRHKRVS
jgi:DnaJ family protein C protein 9